MGPRANFRVEIDFRDHHLGRGYNFTEWWPKVPWVTKIFSQAQMLHIRENFEIKVWNFSSRKACCKGITIGLILYRVRYVWANSVTVGGKFYTFATRDQFPPQAVMFFLFTNFDVTQNKSVMYKIFTCLYKITYCPQLCITITKKKKKKKKIIMRCSSKDSIRILQHS